MVGAAHVPINCSEGLPSGSGPRSGLFGGLVQEPRNLRTLDINAPATRNTTDCTYDDQRLSGSMGLTATTSSAGIVYYPATPSATSSPAASATSPTPAPSRPTTTPEQTPINQQDPSGYFRSSAMRFGASVCSAYSTGTSIYGAVAAVVADNPREAAGLGAGLATGGLSAIGCNALVDAPTLGAGSVFCAGVGNAVAETTYNWVTTGSVAGVR